MTVKTVKEIFPDNENLGAALMCACRLFFQQNGAAESARVSRNAVFLCP